MPKKLVRRGRVRGYRPTRGQLEEVFELAQRGIDKNSVAKLVYSQGNEEIYSEGNDGRILPDNLAQVIKDAGEPSELNNLNFSISQDSPVRRVEIEIGPGDWTRYSIESDDQTWAHGRYHEITEKLLADRSLYAKGSHSSRPQVPREGTDEWRPAAWELVSDWQATIVNLINPALWAVIVLEVVTVMGALANYYNLGADPPNVARSDHHGASLFFSWIGHNFALLFFINLVYIVMVILLGRWLRTLLKSKVVLQGGDSSFFSQLGFQKNRNDAVQLAILYLTFFLLVVGIVTLLVQVLL